MSVDIIKHLRRKRAAAKLAQESNSDSDLTTVPVENVILKEDNKISTADLSEYNSTNIDIEKFRVGSITTAYYLPDFISDSDSTALLDSINSEGSTNPSVWKTLRTRALQCWDSSSGPSTNILPCWLLSVTTQLCSLSIFESSQPPNHVLINRYLPDQGILHHVDGPRYLPVVAILSLSSPCLMTFRPRLCADEIGVQDSGDLFSVCLRPRSLLVFKDNLYTDYMHGIATGVIEEAVGGSANGSHKGLASDEELQCVNRDLAAVSTGEVLQRGVRTSLTIRHMLTRREAEY